MSAAHTPGPWVVQGRENKLGDLGVGPAGRLAAPVAIVMEYGRAGEARDNASLLAAAPELADALEACLLLIGKYAHTVQPETEQGEAALRKAGRLP